MATWFGYPAEVWRACYAAINWLENSLSTTSTQNSSAASVTLQTLLNGIGAIQAWQITNAWEGESTRLRMLRSSYLNLNSANQAIFTSRLQAADAFTAMVSVLPPALTLSTAAVPGSLAAGVPAVPYPGLLEAYMNFFSEVPPTGTTIANMIAMAATEASIWAQITVAAAGAPGRDAAARMANSALYVSELLADLQSGPLATTQALTVQQLWNQIVTVPTLLQIASTLYSAPATADNQQCAAIRYILGSVAQQVSVLLLSLRQSSLIAVDRAPVMQGDSLMDIAARALGDFSQWSSIAGANGLLPPWTSPTKGAGLAQYGSKVFIPQPGSTVDPTAPVPDYNVNVLGTDLYLGPIGQPMLPWFGDYQTISGTNNLRISLGRRMVTSLGDLIYHPDYGSRIPPEVGAVQTSQEAQRVVAFGIAALLADPRVISVPTAVGTVPPGGSGLVEFAATVRPIGQGNSPIPINETLGPS